MLEGYKPIDFGNMFSQPETLKRNRVGMSQVAANILANSEWNQTPISELVANGFSADGTPPKRKQSLWGRFVDLLSTPVYTVANAADDALAGHQSSDTDSVLSDIGQIAGGVVTGAGRGIGTGLRGAFAPSEIAADPKDKQYLGDFLIRLDTHMSAEDAMKPENLEKVRERLKNKKVNQLGGEDKGNLYFLGNNPTDDDIKKYFKDMEMYGLGASMIADPLNFVKGPSNIFSGSKGSAEIPEIISGSKNTYDGFKPIPDTKAFNTGIPKKPLKPGTYKVELSPGSIQNKVATSNGELVPMPEWFDFPSSAADMGEVLRSTRTVPLINEIDPLDDVLGAWASGRGTKESIPKSKESITPVAKIPDNQIKVAEKLSDPTEITKLTGDLLRRAATGDESWANNLLGRLETKYPGIPFDKTTGLIKHVSSIPNFTKRLGIPAERKKIVAAFNRTIHADAQAMKVPPKINSARNIINEATEANPVVLDRLIHGSKANSFTSKNPTRDATVANDTFKKFENQILGSGRPTGIKNPAAYDRAVASGKTVRYSGSQQVQMWNYITSTMKNVKTPNRFALANNILRQVEDLFISKGSKPMSGIKTSDSVPLRLSQVLDSIGPAAAAMNPTLLTKILRGEPSAIKTLPADAVQKIEELKAGESLVDASKAIQGIESTSKSIEEIIKEPISAARTEDIVTIGSKVAEDITRSTGGSPVAGKQASELLRDEFLPKNPMDSAIKSSNLNTIALISHPSVSPKLLKKYSSAPAITRAINKAIGGPNPRQLGKLSGPPARVVEWIGARFNAAYKNSDMRPIYLRNAASAKATVARRAEYLNNLAKRYDVNDADLWNDALKAAQGRLEPLPGSASEALSREILQIMENLFGSSGLKSSIALENSVVGRSQLFMKELNANLHRFGLGKYQFSKKGELLEGTSWLNSWEKWDIDKPLDFLFKIQNVVEHTVREKIMFDEIISRFGTYKRAGEFTHKVDSHPRLAGVYFGKEAASQANQFVKNLKEISKPSSKMMQNFDKVLSKWKAGVTIYIPSHHIRNMIGDVYFNWLGGVNSTRPYSTALKIMQSQKGRYEGLSEISQLTSPDALKKVIAGQYTPTALGKQTALTMRNGTKVSNDMVYVAAFREGILPTTRVLEDIPDDVATGFEKFKPLGGKGQKAAHSFSEARDHYVRLAHFVDSLKKSPKSFEKAVEDAAEVVRKWHPDGMDLTKFERTVMRRMFPFYSWTRKAIPLIVESIVATPGKVMAYPKGQYLLQNMMGMETGPMSDPFPYDQLFPDWIREKGIGPIMGEPGNYGIINPGNPTMDIISQANHPGTMAMGMLNPAARIPIEAATGADSQTGAPIEITDPDYIAKQIPGVSHLGRVTGEFGVSDTTKENSSGYNMQNILNLLTALGYQNTGPYQKSAEFDLREYLRSQR